MLEKTTIECLEIVESTGRELKAIHTEDHFKSKNSIDYANHMTLLLLANKIKNYLKDNASDEFKERFSL